MLAIECALTSIQGWSEKKRQIVIVADLLYV
jgi:hypothetical protein